MIGACLVSADAVLTQAFHTRRAVGYRRAADDNAITALNRRIESGDVQLEAAGASGRLRALLRELAVPESSQVLVFSKTSLQRHRISPASPRALYFGPDVYVAWSPGAHNLEIAASDARLGLVFYELPQAPHEPAVLRRNDSCLRCHAGSRTHDEPGLLLRSVFPDEDGNPIASAGEDSVTIRTPHEHRWGGWLVTGRFDGAHRGNGIAARDEDGRWRVDSAPANDLRAFSEFEAADYLAATSDIGALLALEQQVTVHNRMIRASLQVRCLLADDRAMNAVDGTTGLRERTAEILETLAHDITRDLFLGGEMTLAGLGAASDPTFARAFESLWPAGADGMRLGRLDLGDRTFEYPLSPMVHSRAFAALPEPLRARVLRRLHQGLTRGRLPRGVQIDKARRAPLHAHLETTLAGYRRSRDADR